MSMLVDVDTCDIYTYDGDYGIGIIFDIDNLVDGEKIIVAFDNYISQKEFTVDGDSISFSLALTESDILNIPEHNYTLTIPYSIKRYKENQHVDTLVSAYIKIMGVTNLVSK